MWTLRPLDLATDRTADRAAVESLWRATMAPWPWLPRAFDRLTGGLLALDRDGAPAGVIAVNERPAVAGLPFLAVAPEWQRRGLGSTLLDAAVADLTGRGITDIRAGSGGATYVWPGVPLDLPAAVAFFAAHGWTSRHDSADLTQDLRDYQDPELTHHGVTTDVLPAFTGGPERAEVDVFEAAHFPSWAEHFLGTREDVITARDEHGTVIGTLLFSGPDAGHAYAPLLGPAAGQIGCVGVAEAAQGRGVGSAMVAHASRVLRARGTRTCLIDWTVRGGFYGRLGYRPWRHYRMYRRPTP